MKVIKKYMATTGEIFDKKDDCLRYESFLENTDTILKIMRDEIDSIWNDHSHLDFVYNHTPKLFYTAPNKLNLAFEDKAFPYEDAICYDYLDIGLDDIPTGLLCLLKARLHYHTGINTSIIGTYYK